MKIQLKLSPESEQSDVGKFYKLSKRLNESAQCHLSLMEPGRSSIQKANWMPRFLTPVSAIRALNISAWVMTPMRRLSCSTTGTPIILFFKSTSAVSRLYIQTVP